MSYDMLLSPFKIRNMELKNRVVFPAMGAGLCNDTSYDRMAEYHARRVRGGCALNMIEISAVHITSRSKGDPSIYSDEFIPLYKTVADAVHKEGGKIGVQLWHGGRQLFLKDFDGQIVAPSAIPCSEVVPFKPRALETAEVYELIEAYGDAAVRAQKAGMDCVEIHGAHGYLIDQFLNEYTNKRTDEFGGSFENRCRFGVEVVKNVRKKVGPDYPILMRVNAFERCLVPGGIEIEEAIEAAKKFVEAGVDCLDISQGSYDIEDIQVPPYYYPTKYNAYNAAEFKKAINVPVLCAGRLITPEICEEVLEDGQADLVGLGRVQLCDPDFVNKVKEDRVDEIMHCMGCNQGCVQHIFDETMDGVSCVFHPESGHELGYTVEPTKEPKKILVIGAGPGGLEASRLLAERGHDVTVWEKSPRFGGQINIAAMAPGKEIMLDNMYTMELLARKAGANIRLNYAATKERIEKFAPDFIVNAAGAHSFIVPLPGIEKAHDAWKVIAGTDLIEADTVAVMGGGLVGIETMEILSEQGKHVIMIEMMDAVARDIAAYLHQHTMFELRDYGVDVRVSTKCLEVVDDGVIVEKDGEKSKIEAGAVICALGARSNKDVEEMLQSTGIPFESIGDAKRTGKMMSSIWAANELGRRI